MRREPFPFWSVCFSQFGTKNLHFPLSGLFSKKTWLVLGAGAVRKGSLSPSLFTQLILFGHLIAPTGVVGVYFTSLVSIKHLARLCTFAGWDQTNG